MIQIDSIKRHVYLKFTDDAYITNVLQTTRGRLEYKPTTGEISGAFRNGRDGNAKDQNCESAPETSDRTIRTTLAPYGEIKAYTTKSGRKCTATQSPMEYKSPQ
jgi:hypothetical protein